MALRISGKKSDIIHKKEVICNGFVAYFFKNYVNFTCVHMGGYVHIRAVLVEARRGPQTPGAGVAGGCEPPDTGSGNRTLVL